MSYKYFLYKNNIKINLYVTHINHNQEILEFTTYMRKSEYQLLDLLKLCRSLFQYKRLNHIPYP